MLCGCIDIGSNTTRVLVAEARDGRLLEVLQRRAFTRIGRGLEVGAEIPRAKIEEVAGVVADHRRLAEEAGARMVRTVATAAIRAAANRAEFVTVLREAGGVEVASSTATRRRGSHSSAPRAPSARSCRGRWAWWTSAAARPRSPSARSPAA